MKGFVLIGLSEKGVNLVKGYKVKDKKVIIKEDFDPYRLTFVFLDRYARFLNVEATIFFINKTLSTAGAIEKIDYEVKIL